MGITQYNKLHSNNVIYMRLSKKAKAMQNEKRFYEHLDNFNVRLHEQYWLGDDRDQAQSNEPKVRGQESDHRA